LTTKIRGFWCRIRLLAVASPLGILHGNQGLCTVKNETQDSLEKGACYIFTKSKKRRHDNKKDNSNANINDNKNDEDKFLNIFNDANKLFRHYMKIII
jgi:hypothetical protein